MFKLVTLVISITTAASQSHYILVLSELLLNLHFLTCFCMCGKTSHLTKDTCKIFLRVLNDVSRSLSCDMILTDSCLLRLVSSLDISESSRYQNKKRCIDASLSLLSAIQTIDSVLTQTTAFKLAHV